MKIQLDVHHDLLELPTSISAAFIKYIHIYAQYRYMLSLQVTNRYMSWLALRIFLPWYSRKRWPDRRFKSNSTFLRLIGFLFLISQKFINFHFEVCLEGRFQRKAPVFYLPLLDFCGKSVLRNGKEMLRFNLMLIRSGIVFPVYLVLHFFLILQGVGLDMEDASYCHTSLNSKLYKIKMLEPLGYRFRYGVLCCFI